ncbi:hypothetical protein GEV33_007633 [Tenebrio molitor]|uniref:Uncharacterized protein n=1 Tax=Tenebrio molitor TaxID=7067 RepID=A0A8J6HIU6_TENMO|nr:hypothetical protein GEV33_007633 [Tenebrio molitor]
MVLVYLLISAPTDLAYRSSKQVLNLYSDKEIICMLVWDGPVEGSQNFGRPLALGKPMWDSLDLILSNPDFAFEQIRYFLSWYRLDLHLMFVNNIILSNVIVITKPDVQTSAKILSRTEGFRTMPVHLESGILAAKRICSDMHVFANLHPITSSLINVAKSHSRNPDVNQATYFTTARLRRRHAHIDEDEEFLKFRPEPAATPSCGSADLEVGRFCSMTHSCMKFYILLKFITMTINCRRLHPHQSSEEHTFSIALN